MPHSIPLSIHSTHARQHIYIYAFVPRYAHIVSSLMNRNVSNRQTDRVSDGWWRLRDSKVFTQIMIIIVLITKTHSLFLSWNFCTIADHRLWIHRVIQNRKHFQYDRFGLLFFQFDKMNLTLRIITEWIFSIKSSFKLFKKYQKNIFILFKSS